MILIDNVIKKELSSVMIMLTLAEAQELMDKLSHLNVDMGDHAHISNDNFSREVIISIYTPNNKHYFNGQIRSIIESQNE
jgi:hypothetical protein